MSLSSQLFIGITTWNSEQFLPLCLDSLQRTAADAEIVVLDNESTDDTLKIARTFGARVIVQRSGQADALNSLASMSEKPFTLLIHADVVLLSPDWVPTVLRQFSENVALVSPEDIGCGPYTRPWGKNMPESSFMCFNTRFLDKIRIRRWMRRFRFPYYKRKVDFFGDHITYNLPARVSQANLEWKMMQVHASNYLNEPYYVPDYELKHWSPDLGFLNYGLGNFYSLDGVITHYHNWYDRRVEKTKKFDPRETLEVGGGLPVSYLKAYSDRFISDYRKNCLVLPSI